VKGKRLTLLLFALMMSPLWRLPLSASAQSGVVQAVQSGSVQSGAASKEGLPTLEPPARDEPPDEPMNEPTDEAVDAPVETESVESEPVETEQLDYETERPEAYLRSPIACPTDIETLTALILRDIPDYTNRVLQRTVAVIPNRNINSPSSNSILNEPYRPSFVLIAGRPDLEPIDLNEYAFTTDAAAGGPLTQVFFTTLSRQYSGLKVNEVQEYHWLFLAAAPDGWWLSFMFSAIDNADTERSPLPPRENSQGSVGKAIQLWLRDCRAGAIDRL